MLEFTRIATREDLLQEAMEKTTAEEGQTVFSLKDSIAEKYEQICANRLGNDFKPWIDEGEITPDQQKRRDDLKKRLAHKLEPFK